MNSSVPCVGPSWPGIYPGDGRQGKLSWPFPSSLILGIYLGDCRQGSDKVSSSGRVPVPAQVRASWTIYGC